MNSGPLTVRAVWGKPSLGAPISWSDEAIFWNTVSAERLLLQFSVVYTSRLSKSPQQIFPAGSKISLAKGIDEWVARCVDHETAVGDESCFGGNFNTSGEISEQSANPRLEETQKKRHDYDVDICSCSSFSLPPNHLLLTLLAFF